MENYIPRRKPEVEQPDLFPEVKIVKTPFEAAPDYSNVEPVAPLEEEKGDAFCQYCENSGGPCTYCGPGQEVIRRLKSQSKF
jgi:hypothetical protein